MKDYVIKFLGACGAHSISSILDELENQWIGWSCNTERKDVKTDLVDLLESDDSFFFSGSEWDLSDLYIARNERLSIFIKELNPLAIAARLTKVASELSLSFSPFEINDPSPYGMAVNLKMGNSAFVDAPLGKDGFPQECDRKTARLAEVQRILQELALKIRKMNSLSEPIKLRDYNGNVVGEARLLEPFCPTSFSSTDDLNGCGSKNVSELNEEGYRDFLSCGLLFEEEYDWPTAEFRLPGDLEWGKWENVISALLSSISVEMNAKIYSPEHFQVQRWLSYGKGLKCGFVQKEEDVVLINPPPSSVSLTWR